MASRTQDVGKFDRGMFFGFKLGAYVRTILTILHLCSAIFLTGFSQVPCGRLGQATANRDTSLDSFATCLKNWWAVEDKHSEEWVGLQRFAVMYGIRTVLLGLTEDERASETWNRVNLWGHVSDSLFRGIPSTVHSR